MKPQSSSKVSSYIELTKPRITTLVLITTALGYYLAGQGIESFFKLAYLLFGAGLVCSGSGVLNHYLERDVDCKMLRTQNRPIPTGAISASNALSFGIILILSGLFVLVAQINLLTAFLSLLTAFLYIIVYTPMKRISWLNTTIGAIPGALPPMGGWTAVTGNIDAGAWILFAIMFVWQHPHFYAIAWMFKEDYARGGFKMLPVVEPDGRSTFNQIFWYSLLLIPVSLLPTLTKMSGMLYAMGALLSGIILFYIGLQLQKTQSLADARNLLKATVFYLPFLFFLIILDITI